MATKYSLESNNSRLDWVNNDDTSHPIISHSSYRYSLIYQFLSCWQHSENYTHCGNLINICSGCYTYQQQPKFPSQTHGWSGGLWHLYWNIASSNGELHASRFTGNGSLPQLTCCSLISQCGDIYGHSECHVGDPLGRRCSYAVAFCTIPGNADVCLRPSTKFYLPSIAM